MENAHPAGKRELLFILLCALCSMLLVNVTLFGGCNLGFAVASSVSILLAAGYLLLGGAKPTAYSLAILILCLVIAGSFARSDDGFVKFVMVCFLLVGVNLGLCLLAGKNRRDPGSAASLADAGFALFNMGFGELPASTRGLTNALRNSGTLGQKGAAVLLGLGFAIPALLVIVPLLMAADAAFEGLLDKLPEFNVGEFITTLMFGFLGCFILYTRATALRFSPNWEFGHRTRKGLPSLTLNTLLISVVLVYLVYLASQLAYFVGGFSGILPEEYTMAEYARRGFFEMAALCAVNLGIMVFSLSLCKDGAPKSTRLLCLFLGVMTVFFLSTASAKMLMYIGSYGLTRLRVLTQVIMVFMGLVTILVSVWLFVPKLAYMKAVVLLALVMGAAVSWADVDTQVAKYNVNAYLSGQMETIDMDHLGSLGDGALPHIYRLSLEAEDPLVREMAEDLIYYYDYRTETDIRSWNYVNHIAWKYSREEMANSSFTLFGIYFPEPIYEEINDDHGGFLGDGLMMGELQFSEKETAFLMDQMAGQLGWHALPMTETMERLVENYLTEPRQDVPEIRHGYYYFYDRHNESQDPFDDSQLFDRYSYNLDFAIFDGETGMLYCWQFDT